MDTKEIYKAIDLLSGSKCEITICRGYHLSRAMMAQINFNEGKDIGQMDISPFLMAELCLIDGEQEPVEHYLNMLSDDYMNIAEGITEILKKIK